MSSLFSLIWPTATQDQPRIGRFDLSSIKIGSNIHICGPGRSGKTSVVRDIMSSNKEWYSTVFCYDNKLYPGATGYDCPVVTFNSQLIDDLSDNGNGKSLVVFEDCSIEGKNKQDKSIVSLVKSKQTSIFVHQYSADLSRFVREHITHVFLGGNTSVDNKLLYDAYGKWCYTDYADFVNTLKSLPPLSFMVLCREGDVYVYTPKNY